MIYIYSERRLLPLQVYVYQIFQFFEQQENKGVWSIFCNRLYMKIDKLKFFQQNILQIFKNGYNEENSLRIFLLRQCIQNRVVCLKFFCSQRVQQTENDHEDSTVGM
ncbi:hypothetical protein ABPG72_003264, partial [Tetrahymena utriculariae]